MTIKRIDHNVSLALIILFSSGCSTSSGPSPLQARIDADATEPQTRASEGVFNYDDNHTRTRIQTGRYDALVAKPTYPQRHILAVTVTVTIPEDLHSIGQTLHYLLRRSGYQLSRSLPPEIKALLAKPLPDVHRRLGPMPLKDALAVLTAPAFILVDDPVQRVISFQPIARYDTGDAL